MIYVVYEYNKTGIKIIGAFKSELDVQNCVENNRKNGFM